MDVWEDSTLGDGNTGQELVQLFVIADGKLKVTGDDASLLVVTSSVASKLKDLGGEVLHHSCQVDGGSSTKSLGVVAFLEITSDSAHGEGDSGLCGFGDRLGRLRDFAAFTSSGHLAYFRTSKIAVCLKVDLTMLPTLVSGRYL